MNVRVLGVAALLATVGLVSGYALATQWTEDPTSLTALAPVPGTDPTFPTDPPVEVLPDPDTPALRVGLPLHAERVGSRDFGMRVPVPDEWARTDTDLVESKWFSPDNPLNTYLLRVKIVSGLRLTIAQALAQRRDDLQAVVTDFVVEDQSADTFVATYVNDGYRRLALERFVSLDGSANAFATLAVIGRVSDREGLSDLLERVTDGVERTG